MPAPTSDFITYTQKGLTWISNLSSVHPRDLNGNILLQESSSNNPILIIEPVRFDYTVESVKKVIETRFNFFQFPVTTVTSSVDFNLDTDLGVFEIDPVSKSFKVPAYVDTYGQISTYKRIGTSYVSDWFYNGQQQQRGYTRIPFQTDNNEGSYEITPDILKYARSKNQLIKFIIYIQVTSEVRDLYNQDPNGWNTTFRMKLSRTETYDNWEPFNGTADQPVIYTEDSGRLGIDPKTNKPWRVQNINGSFELDGTVTDNYAKDSTGKDIPTAGLFGQNDYPELYLEYIIDPLTEKPGRKYFIEAEAGSRSWILSDMCRWDVKMINNPSYYSTEKLDFIYRNVYNIGNKNRLDNGIDSMIAIKTKNKITYTNGAIFNRNRPIVVNKINKKDKDITAEIVTSQTIGTGQDIIINKKNSVDSDKNITSGNTNKTNTTSGNNNIIITNKNNNLEF